MLRKLIGVSFLLFALGCDSQHAPAVRVEKAEPETQSKPGMPPNDGFHGMMPPESPAQPAEGPDVILGGGSAHMTAPAGWVRKQPKIGFILAEFNLPRAEGDTADARLTVTVAGGTIKDNVDRWRGQFGEKPEKESKEQVKVSGIDATLVDFTGNFQDQMSGSSGGANSRMLGAIFNLGGQLHFIKCYGPGKTMAAHAAEFRKFVESLKTGGSAGAPAKTPAEIPAKK